MNIFINSGTGVKTNRDKLLVDFKAENLLAKIDIIRFEENISNINNLLQIKEGKYWNTKRELKKK